MTVNTSFPDGLLALSFNETVFADFCRKDERVCERYRVKKSISVTVSCGDGQSCRCKLKTYRRTTQFEDSNIILECFLIIFGMNDDFINCHITCMTLICMVCIVGTNPNWFRFRTASYSFVYVVFACEPNDRSGCFATEHPWQRHESTNILTTEMQKRRHVGWMDVRMTKYEWICFICRLWGNGSHTHRSRPIILRTWAAVKAISECTKVAPHAPYLTIQCSTSEDKRREANRTIQKHEFSFAFSDDDFFFVVQLVIICLDLHCISFGFLSIANS